MLHVCEGLGCPRSLLLTHTLAPLWLWPQTYPYQAGGRESHQFPSTCLAPGALPTLEPLSASSMQGIMVE